MSPFIQWIIVGVIVVAAAVAIIIALHGMYKDPCRGCSLANACRKKDCKR